MRPLGLVAMAVLWWLGLLALDTPPPEKIDLLCEGIRELVRRHPYTRKDYFHVYLNQYGPSSLDMLLYIFWETTDWATELRERHRRAVDILRLTQRLGVEIAFPTQTLHLKRGAPRLPKSGCFDGRLWQLSSYTHSLNRSWRSGSRSRCAS